MNITSAYTIEVLKDQQDNQKLINQLRKISLKNFPENNYDHNDDLVEVTYVDSLECQSRTSRWLLSSRTCILDLTGVHPETKALFASEDWTEIVNNFEQEVKLSQTDIPKIVIHFFDEVNLVFEDKIQHNGDSN
ncbi:3741_t:CDS:2 [Funneliformis geosporum]|uniref:3741_t:CDS:1 n=1 Tax=Funneliformis geosporum TaxID=1117311 RepID=A0A9W4SDP8_9GLOM|nr:3741_t:CDS:2 [Funneliformis geosporum]